MKVILKYKKPSAVKEVRINLNDEKGAEDLKLVLQHEKDSYRINRILGNDFDFEPKYKLKSIKIDGKKTTVNELIEMLEKRNTDTPLKLSKKMKKRMGIK